MAVSTAAPKRGRSPGASASVVDGVLGQGGEHRQRLSPEQTRRRVVAGQSRGRWVIVSTAHPAKFAEIVEPLIGRKVPVPGTLAKLFARPTEFTTNGSDDKMITLKRAKE